VPVAAPKAATAAAPKAATAVAPWPLFTDRGSSTRPLPWGGPSSARRQQTSSGSTAATARAAAVLPAELARESPLPERHWTELGAWISRTGACMHTRRNCDGLRTAKQVEWSPFHQQDQARLHPVTEAWTKKYDVHGFLCLWDPCVCNGRSNPRRKLHWCSLCEQTPVNRASEVIV
jgi:hypothetical protein